jgi:hypothetical protein
MIKVWPCPGPPSPPAACLALLVPLEDLAILVDFSGLFAIWMVCNAHLFRRYYPDTKLRYTK